MENTAYDHIDFNALNLGETAPELVYFGSLIQRSAAGRKNLHRFLERLPAGTPLLYDMNLRPGCDGEEIVKPSLEKADILKINDEELCLTGNLMGSALRGNELVEYLMDRFNIHTVALTLGHQGSVLFMDGRCYRQPATELDSGVVDTVGAGDAFTAVLAWGLGRGLEPEEIVWRASWLAGMVCTIEGAVPVENSFYDKILDEKGFL